MSRRKKLAAIKKYITKERKKKEIAEEEIGTSRMFEGSCEANGEFYTLVERQLMFTHEGYGAWGELNSTEVLDGAYRYVTMGIRG